MLRRELIYLTGDNISMTKDWNQGITSLEHRLAILGCLLGTLLSVQNYGNTSEKSSQKILLYFFFNL